MCVCHVVSCRVLYMFQMCLRSTALWVVAFCCIDLGIGCGIIVDNLVGGGMNVRYLLCSYVIC